MRLLFVDSHTWMCWDEVCCWYLFSEKPWQYDRLQCHDVPALFHVWLALERGNCIPPTQAQIPLSPATLWSSGHICSVQDPAHESGFSLQDIIKNVKSSPAHSIFASPWVPISFLPQTDGDNDFCHPYPNCSCACSTALPFLTALLSVQSSSLVCMSSVKCWFKSRSSVVIHDLGID